MYPHVRLIAAVALIASATTIAGGALVLVPLAVEKVRMARAAIAHSPALPCSRPTWLHSDRDCLSGVASQHDLPGTPERQVASAVPVSPVAVAEKPPQPPLTKSEVAPEHPDVRPDEKVAMAPPLAAEQRNVAPLRETAVTAPPRETTATPPPRETTASPRRAERPPATKPAATKPAARAEARVPAPKKTVRREQAAKRSTEALRVVRRFGDVRQNIPVTAYAPDGTQRRIIIRPTSVQDVYYYSAPR